MGENSAIEWTDHTFNGWIGCSKVHEGCRHCYAETLMDTRYGKVEWGLSGTRVLTSESNWRKPLQWNKAAEKAGVRARVFCSSLADVFEDWRGRMVGSNGGTIHRGEPWGRKSQFVEMANIHIGQSVAGIQGVRNALFRLIDATPWLDWLLLTKRPENIRKMWPDKSHSGNLDPIASSPYGSRIRTFRSNVWLGTSVSDQASYDKQAHELEACRDLSPVLFLSAEPLLAPIDMDFACARRDLSCIDWVIAGGESGPNARPCHPDWVRSLRNQCQAAEVPFFFKQWGAWVPSTAVPNIACQNTKASVVLDGKCMTRVGKKVAGRMLDGREWSEFPATDGDRTNAKANPASASEGLAKTGQLPVCDATGRVRQSVLAPCKVLRRQEVD